MPSKNDELAEAGDLLIEMEHCLGFENACAVLKITGTRQWKALEAPSINLQRKECTIEAGKKRSGAGSLQKRAPLLTAEEISFKRIKLNEPMKNSNARLNVESTTSIVAAGSSVSALRKIEANVGY